MNSRKTHKISTAMIVEFVFSAHSAKTTKKAGKIIMCSILVALGGILLTALVNSSANGSKMLGYKNLRTTQHYAKIVDRKVNEDMKILQQKMADEMKKKDKKNRKN